MGERGAEAVMPLARGPDGEPQLSYKDVTMGRYEPIERKY
jgi:hypothetical protein